MRRIEIGDAELSDQTLLPQPVHLMQGIEPGRMVERPPVELEKIDLLDT